MYDYRKPAQDHVSADTRPPHADQGTRATVTQPSRDPCDGYPTNQGLGLSASSYVYRPPFPTYVAKRQPQNKISISYSLATLCDSVVEPIQQPVGTVRRIVHSTLISVRHYINTN